MSLDMRIINRLLADYADERKSREAILDSRRAFAYRECPELRELDTSQRALSTEMVLAAIEGGNVDEKISAIHAKANAIKSRRTALLAQYRHPADWIDDKYVCPKCSDTGYVQTKPCECLMKRYKKAVIDDFMSECGEPDAEFAKFDLSLYSDEAAFGAKLSPRGAAEDAMSYLRRFADGFDVGPKADLTKGRNFFIFGSPGTGKTYLACCAARVVLERGFTVMYADAADLFSRYDNVRFGRGAEDDPAYLARAVSCDLLVLDNLGGEAQTQSVSPALSRLVNSRLDAGVRTIIISAQSVDKLRSMYSGTVMSRIEGRFYMVYMAGLDLRPTITERHVRKRG